MKHLIFTQVRKMLLSVGHSEHVGDDTQANVKNLTHKSVLILQKCCHTLHYMFPGERENIVCIKHLCTLHCCAHAHFTSSFTAVGYANILNLIISTQSLTDSTRLPNNQLCLGSRCSLRCLDLYWFVFIDDIYIFSPVIYLLWFSLDFSFFHDSSVHFTSVSAPSPPATPTPTCHQLQLFQVFPLHSSDLSVLIFTYFNLLSVSNHCKP